MTAAIPARAFDKIHQEVSRLLAYIPRFLEIDDPQLMKWEDDLEQLPRSQKFLGLALLRHLTGDVEAAEKMFIRAETAGANNLEVMGLMLPVYLNLGYASKALEICRTTFSVKALNIGVGLPLALASGGIALTSELMSAAKKAQLDLSHVSQIRQITRIAEETALLASADAMYAKVLDVAGSIMRKHRLFWLEQSPRFSYDPEMGCIGIRYRMATTPEEASILNEEFISSLISSELIGIPMTLSFVGANVPLPEMA